MPLLLETAEWYYYISRIDARCLVAELLFEGIKLRVLFLAMLLIAGVAGGPANGAAMPKVVVTIAPVHSIVAAVMGKIGRPVLLLDKSLSPHDFSLKPSQARALQGADLVIWIGPEMELPLQGVMQGLSQPAGVLGLLDALARTKPGKERDPHFWLDPQEALWVTDLIVKKLAALDPANAAQYGQNGEILKAEILAAEKSAIKVFAGLEAKPFMIFHNAYGPFVNRLGLNLVGSVQSGHSINPGAATIAALRKRMAAGKINCLASEFGGHNPLVDTLLENTPIRTVALDPLGTKIANGSALYPALIKNLAKDLADCLN